MGKSLEELDAEVVQMRKEIRQALKDLGVNNVAPVERSEWARVVVALGFVAILSITIILLVSL